MKIIRVRKQGFIILLIIFVFIVANVVLLYNFVSGRSRESLRSIQLKEQESLESRKSHRKEDHVKMHKFESWQYKVQRGKRPKPVRFARFSHEKSQPVKEKKDRIKPLLIENKEKTLSNISKKNRLPVKVQKSSLNLKQKQPSVRSFVTPILVIACNRPSVKRCLDQLLKYRPSAEQFPIVVSQDCGHLETSNVIESYRNQVVHIKQPELGDVDGVPPHMRHFHGYYKISRHYKWALGQIFDQMGYDSAIVVEDDLDVAQDFFEYFQATRELLEQDPTLWCVSAWNDNGKNGMVKGNDILYRTDFFPGLGWMLTKSLWQELYPKWPLGFWDDWMREPNQRKGRACIRPEISRTRTFGRIGVSQGQFFDQHLKFIKLNEKPFPFTKSDLTYLLQKNYDRHFLDRVHALPIVTVRQILNGEVSAKEVQVHYRTDSDFESIARLVGAITDFKAGIPRMSYKGVVTVMFKGTRVHLAQSRNRT